MVKVIGEYSAMPPRVFDPVRKSVISGTENAMLSAPDARIDWRRNISRSPPLWGNGRSSTPRTTLKIAVLAPMPRPSVRTTARVNPGTRRRLRRAKRRSGISMGSSSSWKGRRMALRGAVDRHQRAGRESVFGRSEPQDGAGQLVGLGPAGRVRLGHRG